MTDRRSKELYILVVQEEKNGRHNHNGNDNVSEDETRIDNTLEAIGAADRRMANSFTAIPAVFLAQEPNLANAAAPLHSSALSYPSDSSFAGDSRNGQPSGRAG